MFIQAHIRFSALMKNFITTETITHQNLHSDLIFIKNQMINFCCFLQCAEKQLNLTNKVANYW